MTTVGDKIQEIQAYIPYEFSDVAQETLIYNDFFRSIEYAIRKMCKVCRLFEKTVFIPIVSNERYYKLDNFSNYTTDKVEVVKPLALAFITPATNNSTFPTNLNNNFNAIGVIKGKQLEELERNDFSRLNVFYVAQRFFGNTSAIFKTNSTVDTGDAGTFTYLDDVADDLVDIGANDDTFTAKQVVTNLSFSDRGERFQTTIKTNNSHGNYTLSDNVGDWGWLATDRLYISDVMPSFIVYTFQALPQMNYFSALDTPIPLPDQFIDDIEHFAVPDLFAKLAARDPNNAKVLQAVMSTRRIKDEETALRDIKRRADNIKSAEIKPYNIYSFDPNDFNKSNIAFSLTDVR